MQGEIKICKQCQEKLFMQAITPSKCRICGLEFEDLTAPASPVCMQCAVENGLCISCGEMLKEESEC